MTNDTQETLEWLCWEFATDGERFYPPDETAEGCVDAMERALEESEYNEDALYAKEFGMHARAYNTAATVFKDLQDRGYDPVELAENEIERSRENGIDLHDIDWEWLKESHYDYE